MGNHSSRKTGLNSKPRADVSKTVFIPIQVTLATTLLSKCIDPNFWMTSVAWRWETYCIGKCRFSRGRSKDA